MEFVRQFSDIREVYRFGNLRLDLTYYESGAENFDESISWELFNASDAILGEGVAETVEEAMAQATQFVMNEGITVIFSKGLFE